MRCKRVLKILLITIIVGGISACVEVGELKEETHTIQLGEAESVELELNMGAGELRLQGGGGELMEGTFLYNVDRWKPEIDYYVSGNRGILNIRQGKKSGIPVGKTRNKWDINLNNDVPLDIEINFGAGEGKLDFRGLTLSSLDIDMGVGDLTVDLSGEQRQNLDVSIDGGVGSGTLYLPENIGVRVHVDGGIGSISAKGMNKDGKVYTNDAYGKTDVSIDIKIEAGIGSIDLKLK
ncbi:MAG: hypothetical protein E3J56_07705 [Candidatus Aminicenantes bacterium]|nr:MAG: hypothetical protein E3J56_07705 [Candidatus Aminicenantes bacterium]